MAAVAVSCTQASEEAVVEEVVIDSAYVDSATVGTTTDLEDVVAEGEEAAAE